MKTSSVRPATSADIYAVCSPIAKQNIAEYGQAMVTTSDLAVTRQSVASAFIWRNFIGAVSDRED